MTTTRAKQFTEADVKKAKAGRSHAYPTPYLYLFKTPKGVTRYLYRYTAPGPKGQRHRVRETSVGKPGISLNRAREIAAKYAEWLRDGIDPQDAKKWRHREEMTFGQYRDQWINERKDENGESWLRNAKQLLCVHAKPLDNLMLAAISQREIKEALADLNRTAPKQATRAFNMIGAVLEDARAMGYPMGLNPARKETRRHVLPGRKKIPKNHYAAMHYSELPAFIRELRQRQERATAATALEFCILTATRTSETLKAEWSEFEDGIWTIPAERMKASEEHRVPLSSRALEILRLQRQYGPEGKFVFTGYKRYQPLADKSMILALRSMGIKDTVHGFRSAFRNWGAEATDFDFYIIEMCLAHKVGNEVTRAYLRTDVLEKRREIMDAWAAYILK
jgi:integrase